MTPSVGLHMQWKKLGLICNGAGQSPWAASHAALPAVEVRRDRIVRVYFSARDLQGRSHIGTGEIDFAGSRRMTIRRAPVLSPGPLGGFDDSGVTSSCVVRVGSRTYLYYTGWMRGVTVPFYLSVGLAVSADGETFERMSPAPVLDRSRIDPYLTASPWVLVENGTWRMWYVSAIGWTIEGGRPKHHYHIRYAESDDGLNWRRDGRVCIDFASSEEYAFGRPCVLNDEDCYRMWYSYRGERYRIGYAESPDGLVWHRHDDRAGIEPSDAGWDAEMIEYPAVFDAAGRRYMVYNGNAYGRTGIGLAVLEHIGEDS